MDSSAILATIGIGASAFVIALTGAMMPGPLLTVTIEHVVTRGRMHAVLLMVGHALLEALLLVGLAFGLQRFLTLPAVTVALGLVGGGFLLWMGATMMRDAVKDRLMLTLTAEAPGASSGSRLGPVLRGAAVSLANPYWTLWWATVGLAWAARAIAVGPAAVVAFFIGHEAGDFAWYLAVIAAVHSGRRFLSGTTYRLLVGMCAAFLLLLGLFFIITVGIGGMR
jgi:threonine/homoserine/homoserine lactone efflux protein